MKELALSCDCKEKLDECIALLDRSDKSTQVCNTVEGRLKRVSKILFGKDGSQIVEMKEQIDHITDAMNSSLQFLYMKTSASSDRFDISDFRTMLISARSYLEGKDAQLLPSIAKSSWHCSTFAFRYSINTHQTAKSHCHSLCHKEKAFGRLRVEGKCTRSYREKVFFSGKREKLARVAVTPPEFLQSNGGTREGPLINFGVVII